MVLHLVSGASSTYHDAEHDSRKVLKRKCFKVSHRFKEPRWTVSLEREGRWTKFGKKSEVIREKMEGSKKYHGLHFFSTVSRPSATLLLPPPPTLIPKKLANFITLRESFNDSLQFGGS